MPRSKSFDPDDVVDRAMRAFWRNGYEGTSVQLLVETTGINRFSMYQTFGDKRGLFQHVLDHYFDDVLSGILELAQKPERGLDAIRSYFEALATTLTSSIGRLGCLGQNTGIELAFRDSAAVQPLRDMYDGLADNFAAAIRHAIRLAEAPHDTPAADIARYLVTVAQGMILMARTAGDHHYIRSAERQVYAVLDRLRSAADQTDQRSTQ